MSNSTDDTSLAGFEPVVKLSDLKLNRPRYVNVKGTHVVLAVQAELDLPLPAMMKPVLHPLVQAEFERLTERYIDNLITRFGGEV